VIRINKMKVFIYLYLFTIFGLIFVTIWWNRTQIYEVDDYVESVDYNKKTKWSKIYFANGIVLHLEGDFSWMVGDRHYLKYKKGIYYDKWILHKEGGK